MDLSAFKLSFWEMCLADFIAERTPRTRSPDMGQCKWLAQEYLEKYPEALPAAIEAAYGNIEKVIPALRPDFLAFARQEKIPDLLEKPAGLY